MIAFLAVLGSWSSAAAVTLAAYLVGVLSVAGTSHAVDLIARRRDRRMRGWLGDRRTDHFGLLARLATSRCDIVDGEAMTIDRSDDRILLDIRRADGSAFRRTISRTGEAEAASHLEAMVDGFDQWLLRQPDDIGLSVVLRSSAYSDLVARFRHVASVLGAGSDAEQIRRDADQLARFATAYEISRRLREDLPFVLTRLIGTEPDLHDAVDRHNAEGEFRTAVSLPLTVLLCAVAAMSQPLVLLLLLIPGSLFRLGLGKRLDALLILAQALYAGRAWSPVLGTPPSSAVRAQDSAREADPRAGDET
ncbi:hypothetical protein [Streptomyces sp. NPDC059786]|uniref:hypothetical protein n=1 Tax=Streptomyces sp. NPDC059786 TaxID=3346946 RepID=UPI00365994CB